jgi:hemolysin activation/secretion protein
MERAIAILRRLRAAARTCRVRSLLPVFGLVAAAPALAQLPGGAAQAVAAQGLAGQGLAGQGQTREGVGIGLPTIDRDRSDRTTPSLPVAPKVSVPTPAPVVNQAPSAATIALTKVRFTGATLAPSTLDRAVADYVGKPLNTENLQAIANAVGKAYAGSDIAYYSVSIPGQTPVGGVLTVQIVEGTVKSYTLKGANAATPTELIKANVERMMRDAPLRKSTLERSLSLMRDLPGQTIGAQIRQVDTGGGLVLDLTVKSQRARLDLTIDNNGVVNVVSGVQVQAAVTVNGLLREGDTTRVSGYLPFQAKRYQFYSVSHSTPIGSNGLTLGANAAHVESRSRDRRIKGDATLAGITLSYPLIRTYKTNLSLSASLDGVDSSNYYLDTAFGDYRSRAIRLGTSFSKISETSGYATSLVVSRGLNILNAKAFTGFSEKEFAKVNLQSVAIKGLSKTITATVKLNGQYSRDKLPVTERFSLGGPGAGRAYRISTLTAERAAAGSVELAWTPPIASPILKGTALFVFADGAVARTVARPVYALPAENYSLASAGGGVRLAVGPKWRASVEVAVPVKRPMPSYSRKPQFFFGLGSSF